LTQHRAVFRVITLRKLAAAQVVIGVLLLLCALAFYYFAVLRIDYSKTTLLDLAPHPDAMSSAETNASTCRF